MASGHLTIDLYTQGQPPGCLPLGPRLTPASPWEVPECLRSACGTKAMNPTEKSAN